METGNLKHKWLPVAIGILILIALIVTCITTYISINPDEVKYPVFAYFFGINLSLIVMGMLILAFYLTSVWSIKSDHASIKEEKTDELSHKESIQKLLNEDADKRRAFERERNRTSDLFRLIELAKDKHEKTESGPGGEKSDKFIIRIIEKRETIDLKKLETLIQFYNNVPVQTNTENNV